MSPKDLEALVLSTVTRFRDHCAVPANLDETELEGMLRNALWAAGEPTGQILPLSPMATLDRASVVDTVADVAFKTEPV